MPNICHHYKIDQYFAINVSSIMFIQKSNRVFIVMRAQEAAFILPAVWGRGLLRFHLLGPRHEIVNIWVPVQPQACVKQLWKMQDGQSRFLLHLVMILQIPSYWTRRVVVAAGGAQPKRASTPIQRARLARQHVAHSYAAQTRTQ